MINTSTLDETAKKLIESVKETDDPKAIGVMKATLKAHNDFMDLAISAGISVPMSCYELSVVLKDKIEELSN